MRRGHRASRTSARRPASNPGDGHRSRACHLRPTGTTWKGTRATSPSALASRSPVSDRAPEVIGCLYIYPAKDRDGEAQIRSRVRADVAELDGPLHGAVSRWLTERWPFEHAIYADRPMTRDLPPKAAAAGAGQRHRLPC